MKSALKNGLDHPLARILLIRAPSLALGIYCIATYYWQWWEALLLGCVVWGCAETLFTWLLNLKQKELPPGTKGNSLS